MFGIEDMLGSELPYKEEMQATLVNTSESFDALIKDMHSWSFIVFDLETTGLSFMHHEIVGVSLTTLNKPSYYIPLRHRLGQNMEPAVVIPALYQLFQGHETVAHNFKFDYNFMYWELEELGFENPEFNTTHDTMIMNMTINPGKIELHGLKGLVKKYFGIDMLCYEDVSDGADFSFVSIEDAVVYACGDAYFTLKLFQYLKEPLMKQLLLPTYVLEMSCLKGFAEMERVGVPVDKDKLDPIKKDTEKYHTKLTEEIHKLAGRKFNISSPKELSVVLYDEHGVPKPKEANADGSYSTAIAVLEQRTDFPIIRKIIKYRAVEKMLNSFLSKTGAVLCEDGRIRTTFKQLGARSGRVATSGGIGPGGINPKINMQQFPKKTDKDEVNFRDFLIAPPDYYILAADFKQIEYRLMACMSGEVEIIELLKKGYDFHKATAAIMLGKSYDQVTKKDRNLGKTLNFGICYGMSHYSLARTLGITLPEAKALQDQYFARLPKLCAYIERIKQHCWAAGEVRTEFGRKRDFSNIHKFQDKGKIASLLRSAFNTVIQGTAADVNKMAVRDVYNAKRSYGKKILMALNVHDELVLFVHNSIPIEEAIKVIMNMEQNFPDKGWVSLGVDPQTGPSYGTMKTIGDDSDDEPEAEMPEIVTVQVEETFDRVVVIEVDEFADYKAIKLACSPAVEAAYRVVFKGNSGYKLLPRQFTCNPTEAILSHLQGLSGVSNAFIKVTK
jgi:DNA polymerase-1